MADNPNPSKGIFSVHNHQIISTADIVGSDVFFEIIDPIELEYTYRIRPAKDFGAPFVSTTIPT